MAYRKQKMSGLYRRGMRNAIHSCSGHSIKLVIKKQFPTESSWEKLVGFAYLRKPSFSIRPR